MKKKIERIVVAINDCRFLVLRAVEFELEGNRNLPVVRARILKAFGDKGLMGDLNTILFQEEGRTKGGLK